MRAVWENHYRRLIQAIYGEDRPFLLRYGSTPWLGVLNSLQWAVAKVCKECKVYRVEDELGVIMGFGIINHDTAQLVESHIRPSQLGRGEEFYKELDKVRTTGNGYTSFVVDGCIDTCSFLKATTSCNFMPFEFQIVNGVIQYRLSWSNTWMPIFNITVPNAKIEFRKYGGYLQYKYTDETSWINIFKFDEFKGEKYVSQRLPVTINKQVTFVLNDIVIDKESSLLFVNGQKRYYPVDYTIAGNVLTWVDTDFDLKIDYEIDFYYQKP